VRRGASASRAGRATVDMWITCEHALHMSKMIQIRNVPDELHRKLRMRAVAEGVSLSDLLLAEARRLAERPSLAELRERLAARAPVAPRVPPATAVREERDAR